MGIRRKKSSKKFRAISNKFWGRRMEQPLPNNPIDFSKWRQGRNPGPPALASLVEPLQAQVTASNRSINELAKKGLDDPRRRMDHLPPSQTLDAGSVMSDTTSREEVREVIKDKLEAVEARIDAKLAGIDGKIDRLVDAVTNSAATSQKEAAQLRDEMRGVRADNKNTRWTIGVTIAVAMLAALAALWTTQANLLSAFTAGIAGRPTVEQSSQPTPDHSKKP
jgi:hypothetical protein